MTWPLKVMVEEKINGIHWAHWAVLSYHITVLWAVLSYVSGKQRAQSEDGIN